MKKLICSACVMAMMSFTLFDVVCGEPPFTEQSSNLTAADSTLFEAVYNKGIVDSPKYSQEI